MFKPCLLLSVVTASAIVLTGCQSEEAELESPKPVASGGGGADDDHPHPHPQDSRQTEAETIKAEMAKLSPEDRASAERQEVCAVSGEKLGTMGVPLKVEVNGRDVWVCCENCKDPLLENPDEYLANLESE